MAVEHHYVTPMVPLTFTYNYRVGAFMEKYLQGLAEKRLYGVRCPGCKRVLVPPRSACGQCHARPDEWVELPASGTLEYFTVAHVCIEKGEIKDLAQPVIIGMVRVDGADSLLTAKIQGVAPSECRSGLRVKAVLKDPPAGTVHDLDHFKVVS